VQKILREQGIDQVKRISEQAEAPKEAPEAAAKRGRRGKAQGAQQAKPSAAAGNLRAAIAELELCREILMGKAVETSGRRRAKPRRDASP
jgi:hypothetical protein